MHMFMHIFYPKEIPEETTKPCRGLIHVCMQRALCLQQLFLHSKSVQRAAWSHRAQGVTDCRAVPSLVDRSNQSQKHGIIVCEASGQATELCGVLILGQSSHSDSNGCHW